MAFLGLEDFVDKDRLDTAHNDNALENTLDVDGHNLTIAWDAGELGVLGQVVYKSITGHRKFEETSFNDLDGSTIQLTQFHRDIEYEQFSQEFQMIGTAENLNYTLGLYYFEEEADVEGPQRFFGVFTPDGVGWITNNYGIVGNDSWAIFGQTDWSPQRFDERLIISVGARYTSESKELYRTRIESDGTVSVPEGTTADDDYSDFSPSLSVSWYLNEDSHVYGKISSGFRSGGFNDAANSVDTFQLGFDQEELTAYEIGYKSRWLDNRLQVNTAVFFSDYTDMQISNFIPDPVVGSRSIVNNAGAAEITGLELEITAQPTADLNIMFSYGYLDGDYQEYLELDPGTGEVVDVKKDRAFPFVAKHSGSLSMAWDMLHFDWGVVTGRFDYSYIDDHFTYAKNFESTEVEAYDLLDARLTLSEIPLGSGGRQLELALWAKNLTDEEYRTHGIDFGAFGFSGNYFGNPRTYGAFIRYQF